jgi:hypothetical protein
MSETAFLQRPEYHHRCSIAQLRQQAQAQSRQGHYNVATLWLFRRIWQYSNKGADYLAYVLFRRALGYSLTATKAQQLQRLNNLPLVLRLWQGVFGHRQRQLNNLLAEYIYQQQQQLMQPAVLPDYRQQVFLWRRSQQQWQQELIHWLERASSIKLIGNSPSLASSNAGEHIDNADIVIRFNRFQSKHTQIADSGSKLDIWIMAPDYQQTLPDKLHWCLVSGPDIVWQQQRWPQFSRQSPEKLLGIPLPYWRQLVRQLAAPPSAGLLVAHYFRQICAPDKIALHGFGFDPTAPQYHYASPQHKAVSRHNWAGELTMIQQWQNRNKCR